MIDYPKLNFLFMKIGYIHYSTPAVCKYFLRLSDHIFPYIFHIVPVQQIKTSFGSSNLREKPPYNNCFKDKSSKINFFLFILFVPSHCHLNSKCYVLRQHLMIVLRDKQDIHSPLALKYNSCFFQLHKKVFHWNLQHIEYTLHKYDKYKNLCSFL
jgi:hypothetical protein